MLKIGFTMFSKESSLTKYRLRVLMIFSLGAVISVAGLSQDKKNARTQTSPNETQTNGVTAKVQARYVYEFKQPEFVPNHILIEHDETGRGKITFERKGEETIVEPLAFSESAWARIVGLFNALHFLDSQENYQSDKQYPHLGTVRLRVATATRERTVEFNWTNNHEAFELANEYRRAADQAIFVFDLTVARDVEPLNTPQLMDQLELLLKYGRLSEPRQLVPVLKDLSTDERVPLIARNHANRLIKRIEK